MIRVAVGLLLCFYLTVQASAQDRSVRLEGQVVCCAECWAEADRTKVEFGTAKDLLKSQACVANGDPTLIAVRESDRFTLYQLEQGKYRLPGRDWLEFVGKRVAVFGAIKKSKNAIVIRVDRLEVLAQSKAERDAANVIGTEVSLILADLLGAMQSLNALKGRIVVLNFWATYCEPCRKEMPDLAAIQNSYAALGVQVIGASADDPGDRAKVLQFVKETRINFPIWMGATTADMLRFGLGGALPGTVLLGRDGRIAKVISGPVNEAALRKQIDAMLASADVPQPKEPNQNTRQVASAKQKPSEVSSVPS